MVMMAMQWSDRVISDGIRVSYVPPHLRPNSFSDNSRHRDAAESSRYISSGSRHIGRDRGRGSRPRRGRSQFNQSSAPETSPFEPKELEDEDGDGINFDAYEDIPVELSGANVPSSVDTFEEIDLGKAVNENIRKCKYSKPTPVQRHAISIAIAGRDLMACAQTGSGKTAAFCLPIICGISRGMVMQGAGRIACPTGLILSPTRELSCQIHDEVKKFAYQTGLKSAVVYGGAPIVPQV